MRFKIVLFLLAVITLAGCKKDFLERLPQDQLTDDTYWTSETNVRTFAWAFYPAYFGGYGSGFAWGKFFSGQALNDDFAPSSPLRTRASNSSSSSFEYVLPSDNIAYR